MCRPGQLSKRVGVSVALNGGECVRLFPNIDSKVEYSERAMHYPMNATG